MKTSFAFVGLAVFSCLGLCTSSGCASDDANAKAFYGTYDAMVSAFGKTDPTVLTVSEGVSGALILDFTQGFTTDVGAVNASGLRATLDGGNLKLAAQPVHVDHSTGEIDGTVTGIGTLNGTNLSLTLDVTPNSPVPDDDGGTAVIDYEVMGSKQSS
jgi:hypothetical protein